MYLNCIKLTNFRGFESFEMTFNPEMTVLVGRNGSGKSSLLNAVEMVVSHFLISQFLNVDLGFDNLRVGAQSGEITATWEQPKLQRTLTFKATGNGELKLFDEFHGIAYWKDLPLYKIVLGADRTRIIDKPSMQFERLLCWFREREDIENRERIQRKDSAFQDPALNSIRRAVTKVLGAEYGFPRIDRTKGARLVLKKGTLELSAQQLSDGERGLLVIVATIARRLFLSDPNAQDPLRTPAIILIDEVEMHLYPAWQRELLPRLKLAFPGSQFIVSTNSALVLSKAESSWVRIIEKFSAYNVNECVYGRDANALLRDIFGVTDRPEEVLSKIGNISTLLDAGKLDEAARKLSELESIVGPTDSEVVRIRAVLGFLRDKKGLR
jgi:predicted ATP-binding protein involved in virulence